MKKVIAVAIVVCVVALMAGIALAEEGAAKSAGTKGGPALNNMANWIISHFPSHEKSVVTKEVTPPLSDEELKAQREKTGMGMRGRVGNERHE